MSHFHDPDRARNNGERDGSGNFRELSTRQIPQIPLLRRRSPENGRRRRRFHPSALRSRQLRRRSLLQVFSLSFSFFFSPQLEKE